MLFMGITIAPLYLIFWLKKRGTASPLAKRLNQCIQHGQTLSSDECGKINDHLNDIKASLESFARDTSSPTNAHISLAQAIEALPLLYEISQPGTCCERICDGLTYHKKYDCKAGLRALLEELRQSAELPLISEKLEEIVRIRRRIEAGSRRRKPLVFLFVFLHSYVCFLLTQTILLGRASWKIELGIYLGGLSVFFLGYDYYYSKKFKRYQKS